MLRHEFGVIFWIHLIIIVGIYFSPFLIPFKMIVVLGLLYILQIFLFKGCVLTILQFGKKSNVSSFHGYYLSKLGFSIQKRKLEFMTDVVYPVVIPVVALVWQVILGMPTVF